MFEWTNPRNVRNFREYYLYLLFSSDGRIGRRDFARGLFFRYFPLIIIAVISFVLYTEFFFDWSLWSFLVFVVLLAVIIFILLLPPLVLAQKRLNDMGYSSGSITLILIGAFFGTFLWLLGPIILVSTCLFMPGERFNNVHGKPCTLHEELKRKKANLINRAKSCLGRNDFEGAILSYTELGDSKSVQKTKKAHISHNYDLLYSQVSRMNDNGILCVDLMNTTYDLSSLVNSYLGIKPQEPPSTLPKSEVRLSSSESESGKEELKAE